MTSAIATYATEPTFLQVWITFLAPGVQMHGIDPHCRNVRHGHYWKPNPYNWYPEDQDTS